MHEWWKYLNLATEKNYMMNFWQHAILRMALTQTFPKYWNPDNLKSNLIKRISINLLSSQKKTALIRQGFVLQNNYNVYCIDLLHLSLLIFSQVWGKSFHVWNHPCSQNKEKMKSSMYILTSLGEKCARCSKQGQLEQTGQVLSMSKRWRLGRLSGQLILVSDHTHSKSGVFLCLSNHSFSNHNTTWLIKCSSLLKLSFFLRKLSCLQYT